MLPGISSFGAAVGAVGAPPPPVNPVHIENENISDTTTDNSTATASFTFRTDRTVQNHDGTTIDTSWLDADRNPADFEIRVTKNSGSNPAGLLLNTWYALSSNRTWSLSQGSGAAGEETCQLTVEIREITVPGTILDTATYTLTADSQGPADWSNISATRTTSSITANSSSEEMGASGTLTIAYSGVGLTLTVLKNGVSQGSDTSLPVSAGDLIQFTASGVGFVDEEERTGTITVSGLYSDTITVFLKRSSA